MPSIKPRGADFVDKMAENSLANSGLKTSTYSVKTSGRMPSGPDEVRFLTLASATATCSSVTAEPAAFSSLAVLLVGSILGCPHSSMAAATAGKARSASACCWGERGPLIDAVKSMAALDISSVLVVRRPSGRRTAGMVGGPLGHDAFKARVKATDAHSLAWIHESRSR